MNMRAQTKVPKLMSLSNERAVSLIGTLLLESGKINPEDTAKVLRRQEETGLKFGEAAIRLGLVSAADVNEVIAQQFAYRYVTPGQSRIAQEVIAAYDPFSEKVEDLRGLRAQLMQRCFGPLGQRRHLVIAGCDRRAGRSYLAANLAVVFSQLGQRTVLVDADMRNPRQHDVFGIANSVGLSTVLAGRSDLTAIQRIPELTDLSVLTSGPVPPNPAELLERPALAEVLEQLAASFDVVLLDTSAVDKNTDACSVAARAGAALIVTHRYRTRVKAVQALIAALPGVEVVGTALNDF
jgi:protein-tyrosine kinase